MRRIILFLTVALVMAAMVVATAAPAFAVGGGASGATYPCLKFTGPGEEYDCRGGGGGCDEETGRCGGYGGQYTFALDDPYTGTYEYTARGGGGGSSEPGSGGGGGGNCSGDPFVYPSPDDCTPQND
jgi:hypothetical protein